MSFLVIYFIWEENNPNEGAKSNILKSYGEAIQELKKRKVFCVGIMESLFLATNSIFLFSWTPILESSTSGEINVGIIFVCFILSMISGTMLFEVNSNLNKILLINLRIDYIKSLVVFFIFECSTFFTLYMIKSFTIRLILLSIVNVLQN